MTQTGTVKKISEDRASVSVIRRSACKGCSMSGCMGCGKAIETPALNKAGAVPGDTVEIESPSGTILKYAALVFLMPVILAAVFYYIGYLIFGSSALDYVFAAIPVIGSFVFLRFYLDKKASEETEFVITKVITHASAPLYGTESTDIK